MNSDSHYFQFYARKTLTVRLHRTSFSFQQIIRWIYCALWNVALQIFIKLLFLLYLAANKYLFKCSKFFEWLRMFLQTLNEEKEQPNQSKQNPCTNMQIKILEGILILSTIEQIMHILSTKFLSVAKCVVVDSS